MPLPPALLARLKRRGIVKEESNEEVIAENYDAEATNAPQTAQKMDKKSWNAPGCPNKWNPYHYCVQYCYDHWKNGTSENKLPQKYTEARLRVLKKYPIPNGWKEVYDPGCARHYYWCPRTDEVSWLPPSHPQAVIGDAAAKISRSLFEKRENTNGVGIEDEHEDEEERDEEEVYREDRGGTIRREDDRKRKRRSSLSGSDEDNSELSDSDEERRPELSDRDKLRRAKRKGIDPMDPAAYGDNVPIGKWSSGLNAHDKTGADVTASGPLFQQRPYPAPGAVLRKQQQQQQ